MSKLIQIMLLSAVLALAGTVNYSYDASGRLVKIDYGSGGSITYVYDNAGNLLSRTVVPAGQTKEQTAQKEKRQAGAAPATRGSDGTARK